MAAPMPPWDFSNRWAVVYPISRKSADWGARHHLCREPCRPTSSRLGSPTASGDEVSKDRAYEASGEQRKDPSREGR